MSFWKSVGKIGHKFTKSVGNIGDSVHDAVGDVGHKIVKTAGAVGHELVHGDVGGAGDKFLKGSGSVGHAVVTGFGDVGHTVANDELVQTAHNVFTKIPTRLANKYKAELAWIPYFGQANLIFGDLVNHVINPEDYEEPEAVIDASLVSTDLGQDSGGRTITQITYSGGDGGEGYDGKAILYPVYYNPLPVVQPSTSGKPDLTWLPMVASVIGLISSL